jgi:hypothetical protein
MTDHYLYRPFLYTFLILASLFLQPEQAEALTDTRPSASKPSSDDKKISIERAEEILKKLPQGDTSGTDGPL